jgi:tetratricopeptide (TPR) repeat protein
MLANGKFVLLPALLSASLAVAAGAQQKECAIDEGKPGQVARALLSVSMAQNAQAAGKPADAAKALSAAVKALTENPEKINNTLGRNLVLGKALSLWVNQPGQSMTPTRGSLGYATSPEQTIDLVAAVDSAFAVVEASDATCAGVIAPWRAQKPWVEMVNGSIELFNNDKLDSAEVVARRSILLYKAAPYGHMVLGNVSQKRGNPTAALQHYRMAVDASKDTTFNEARRTIMLTMAQVAAEIADTASGAAKQQWATQAAQSYEELIKTFPGSQQASAAAAGLSRMRLASGDTAGFRAAYAEQIASPEKFTYQDILASAVGAARANQYADAAHLFENALKLNPYNRDALFNAAIMYYQLNEYAKMLPFIGTLVKVDPSNGENWRLYAHAYNGLGKALKPVETKPAAGARRPAGAKPAVSPAVEAQIRALNDSTVKYYEMAEKMPVQVEFTEWTNLPDRSTLGGTILNKDKAPKSYTITIEFLDKAGQVVATQTATVADVAPNAKGRFSVNTNTPDVIAFRYKPIS